ncbi:MAG: hypothetical protein WC485_00310 [Opitutaceae bacterium]
MSNKHLQLKPHRFKNRDGWWYEEPEGIMVVVYESGQHTIARIRWSSLRAALKRKDKKP